jgi:ubiquinone/menaquinone biosynthesis C-methylase UbiE
MSEDIFEDFAEDYDRWFDEHRKTYLAELARIRTIIPLPDNRSIEIGAGSGRFAGPLGIPLGIEPSAALARMARRRGIEVLRGMAETIPFRNKSFSSALMVTVICFLQDPVLALSEIHRILDHGGRIIVAFIERDGEIARKYLHEPGKHRFLSRARFYSTEEVQRLLKHAGFEVINVDSKVGFTVIAARKDEK